MTELYAEDTATLAADDNDMPPFDDEAFRKAAEYIYKNGGYNSSMLRSRPVREVIEVTYHVFKEAIDRGITHKTPAIVTDTLNSNAFIFSGLKVNHSLSELNLSLTDNKRGIKSFNDFNREVERINEKYNRNYLRTEYNHAVASAQMAAKWHDLMEDGDEYDLQYRTSGDEKVRSEHRLLDGLTFAADDPFWDRYMPPNGWNCRCTVVQIRKGKYPKSDSQKAIELGDAMTDSPKLNIFRFNPGKDLTLFPGKHPYFKTPRETKELIDIALMRVRAKEIRETARNILVNKSFSNKYFDKPIAITNKGIKEWLNQPHRHIAEKNEMLLDMDNILKEAKYLGRGEDKHNGSIVVHIFETAINGDKSWIIVREFPREGICHVHSISDSENILNYIQEKPSEK